MKLKNADIYTENTLTGQIIKFKSLKDACYKMFLLSNTEKSEVLLCIGNWNLDYIGKNETSEKYYKRMLKMTKNIK